MALHPAVQRRIDERQRLLQRARAYARDLAHQLPIRWAIVAGSVARGDFHAGSDIDVLVISDALPAHPLVRAERLYAVAGGGVEPKGFTPGELARQLGRRNPLVEEALTRGVVVYPDGVPLAAVRRELGLGPS